MQVLNLSTWIAGVLQGEGQNMENKKAEACESGFRELQKPAPRQATRRRAVRAVCDSISQASHRRPSLLQAAGTVAKPQSGSTVRAPGTATSTTPSMMTSTRHPPGHQAAVHLGAGHDLAGCLARRIRGLPRPIDRVTQAANVVLQGGITVMVRGARGVILLCTQ